VNLTLSIMSTLVLRLFCLASTATLAFGQGNSDTVRNLNNRVLQLHSEIGRANAAAAAQIRAQAGPVIAQRAAAMVALIKQDPGAALGLAFSKELRADLAAKFPASASAIEEHGSWAGKSDHLIFDDVARQTRRYQVSVNTGAGILEIYSAKGEPECVSGNTLTSTGIKVNNVVAAGSTNVTSGSLAPAATCSSMGAQNSAVILVSFPGYPLPSTVTPSSVNDIFFGATGKSVNTYWKESSYNQASATGQVFGPYALSQVYSCDQYNEMRTAAIKAADPDVDFTKFTRVFIVFANPGSCAWAGLGSLGCGTLSTAEGNVQASTSWLLATQMGSLDNGVKLAAHEGGHNLSLHHAASRDFGTEAVGALGAAGTLNEYGDPFSTMGTWNFGHYSAQHKAQIGWLNSGNVATVETPGSFSILPFETPTLGVQALKVRRGTGGNSWLWLEYRQPIGVYDSTLGAHVHSGALTHLQDSTTGTKTHLVDFTPGTTAFTDAALTGAWTDPYTNLTLAVTGATPSALSVNVGYGVPTCDTRLQPTVSISPTNPTMMAGTEYAFTLSVTNNDPLGCSSSTFQLTTGLPSGWATTFSSPSLTITPGQTLTATMRKTAPVGFAPGTYVLDATASDSLHSRTATNNVTVIANTCVNVNPTLSLSPATASVVRGASQSFTLTLRNNDASSCATRSFNLSSSLPTGCISSLSTTTLTLAAGATGTATLTKTVPVDAAFGATTVNAAATGGSNTASATATVTVQQSITVTLTALPAIVSARSNVTLTATVKRADGSAAAGASVTFRIVRGTAVSTGSATANSSGVATYSYRAQQKGSYTATATATLSGATATSNTTTFTAQ
jgi:M6 family metalloprotease-like protein